MPLGDSQLRELNRIISFLVIVEKREKPESTRGRITNRWRRNSKHSNKEQTKKTSQGFRVTPAEDVALARNHIEKLEAIKDSRAEILTTEQWEAVQAALELINRYKHYESTAMGDFLAYDEKYGSTLDPMSKNEQPTTSRSPQPQSITTSIGHVGGNDEQFRQFGRKMRVIYGVSGVDGGRAQF